MNDWGNKSAAGRRRTNWHVRLGAALVAVCLAAIGALALPLATAPEKALPAPADSAGQEHPPDDSGGYTVSDGAVVSGPAARDESQRDVPADAGGDSPESDYEIVTDDGIALEHQGGVVLVQIAEGCTLDELNAEIKALDCLAPQAVDAEDVSLGWVKLRLAEGIGVADAAEALNASAVLQGAQPNYVYRLDEVDEDAEAGKTDLQVGSYIAAPEPIEVEPTGAPGVGVDNYWDFVNDTEAWNQMALMTVRAREAYFYTHDNNIPIAWEEGEGGANRPAIAILDTGCYIDHPDLKANMRDWYDAVAKKKQDNYIESHGTHVAGIAAAVTNNNEGITGMSFNAKIVSVKVFKRVNGEVLADSLDILSGYEFVLQNAAKEKDNIRVINMSLGATTENTDNDDKALLDAIDRAYRANIVTTISAGNDALSKGGAYSDFPTDFAPHAVGVIDCGVTGLTEGYYQADDNDHLLKTQVWLTRDNYSNFNMVGTMNKQISALGSSVMSTVPLGYGDVQDDPDPERFKYYGRKDGTSMASPCVAGIAALALSVNPDLSVDELESLLYTSAVDVDERNAENSRGTPDPTTAGFDLYTGFGTVDAYNAVVAADTHTYLSGATLVAKGGTISLSIPEAANATNVTWGSSDGNIATVTANEGGRSATVRANKGGQVIVSATCTVPAAPSRHGARAAEGAPRQVTLHAIVTVYDASITGGSTVQFGRALALGMDVTAKNGTWEWASSDPSVATVDKWAGEKTKTVNVIGKKPGTATITATLTSDRSITASKTVQVTQVDIGSASVTVSPASFEYDGKAKTPAVTVKMGSTTLRNGTDYTVSYSNNINAGSGALVTVTGKGSYTGTVNRAFTILPNAVQRAHRVQYRTHVQNVGWQGYVKDGATAGTSGRGLRLEGINISLADKPYSGSIRYRTHIQNIGWESGWKYDGAMSGTNGRSLRLEAIQIELTGDMAKKYDVYYRVHCQNIGWMGWAKNGMQAGTAGFSYRLEAIQIKLVPKGSAAPGSTSNAFRNAVGSQSGVPDSESSVLYRTHVQNVGWQNFMRDGEVAGTSGRSLRLEGINIKLGGAVGSGGVKYRTHVQNIGWQSWVSNGRMAGTSGRGLRLEAIEIELTGAAAGKYDVYYRVHCQNIGWMGWAKNGQRAGTAGYSYRLEAVQIRLVPKGGAAPGSTAGAFRQR